MRRKIHLVILVLCASLPLSACDKCGGLQDIRYPGSPRSCADGAAR
jgi:predicted small secreted protein